MNLSILKGNLVTDPELRHTSEGAAVVKGRIAVQRRFKKDVSDFFNFTVWGKSGEAFAKFFKKGSMVLLEGEMHNNVTEKDGKKTYWAGELNVLNWEFCTPKAETAQPLPDAPADPWADTEDKGDFDHFA